MKYKYIDLSGGTRPWLLSRVENGLGKSTDITYTTSTAQMLAAARTPATTDDWTKLSPVVLHMVAKVTVKDNLGNIGCPAGEYVTEYTYANPVYDGLQREFRGFESSKVRTIGDENSPSSEATSEFLLGERPWDLQDNEDRWKDNPNEALKGLPKVAETTSLTASGSPDVYSSTTGTTYVLRKLYDGKDGRGVYSAFAKQTDAWLYDTSSWTPSASSTTPSLLRAAESGDQVYAPELTVRAATGTKHTASDVETDVFGNRTSAIDYGVVGSDEAIEQVSVAQLVDAEDQTFGDGRWSWRTTESYVVGAVDTTARKHSRTTTWNGRAEPVTTQVEHQEPGMLERDDPNTEPSGQASTGWLWAGDTHYDAFGNVLFTAGLPSRLQYARRRRLQQRHRVPRRVRVRRRPGAHDRNAVGSGSRGRWIRVGGARIDRLRQEGSRAQEPRLDPRGNRT